MLQGEEVIRRILVLAMISLGAFSGCCRDGIDITVKKHLSANLDRYHMAEVSVQDEDYATSVEETPYSSKSERIYIEVELSSLLTERGISQPLGDKDAIDLRVKGLFKRRIGCAEIGLQHLSIEFKHISFVNLKFIDAKTDEIIGEVECRRKFWKSLPAGFIKLMFDELMKGSGEKRRGLKKLGDGSHKAM